ncbi:lipid A deacylase LpxR family protein [Photobacterium gaetbulicola]|uniref:lipid A deacylase LpxR family protein n=1 Tax=Photobacterium gaetbulicola TaxID=1295392 RepID=UPI00068FF82B|nr:lipid A deacylase LpxR family protein [Photobacterium gaetbulicola]
MKQFSPVFFVCLSALAPNAFAYNAGSFSFSMDNDGIVGTDQNYTNGVFFEYNSPYTAALAETAPTPIRQISQYLPFDEGTKQGWSLTLGQQMWTPEDIEALEPPENDRPYAGLLFLESSAYQYSPTVVDKFSLMIGIVGPNSFAEQGQKFIHEIVGSDEPMGWDYQIENTAVFNLGYQGHRLLTRQQAYLMEDYDLSGVGRVNIGNYQSELAVGGVARWGKNLANNFGTTGFTPGNFVDIGVLSSSSSGYFIFAGVEGRYRFNDITIEGDRPSEVPDTNVKHWQATSVIGGVFYQPKWGASLSFATSTPEFKENKHRSTSTGSLELFWRI